MALMVRDWMPVRAKTSIIWDGTRMKVIILHVRQLTTKGRTKKTFNGSSEKD